VTLAADLAALSATTSFAEPKASAVKSLHRPFSSPEWQMRISGTIVLPAAHLAAIQIAQIPHRCRVRSEAVGDDRLRSPVPRAASRSSAFRKLSGNRTYSITTRRMTSGEEWK
jgi:hypothetical protein